MTDINDRNVIGLTESDLDLPIYRIYALDRFEPLLASGQDALVNPIKWEDPFENFFLERTEVRDDVSGTCISLKNLAEDWYGQCWSLHKETDAMWRIYSPDPKQGGGVKVRTTCRRLFENLKRAGSTAPYLQFFIGRVTYMSQANIENLMRGLTFSDVAIGGQGDGFAKLLCIKRDTFQHENEIRLLFQDIDLPVKRGTKPVFKYSLDPNSLFDELVLDPRLEESDALALKARLHAAGCRLPIEQSSLYHVPRFIIGA